MIPIDPARIQAILHGYQVGGELGRGGFGLVLAGRHLRLGRPVAIKVMDAGGDGDGLARFMAEAQVLAALDHPHVVRIYDYVEAGTLCLIVMEQLPGGALRARAGTGGAFDPAATCAVGLAVAQALAAAHGAGVLHRDIKPGNVLFAADGTPKVTDFGVAKMFDGSAASASTVVGTPLYMAPEQWEGSRLGPATDVYALGVMLYEQLAGHPPFGPNLSAAAMMRHHLTVPPPLPDSARVPAPVATVVQRALAKDPADRHGSAHAFGLDLARAAAAALGRDWLTRCGIPVRLDDETRDAARPQPNDAPTAPRRPEHTSPPSPPPPPQAGAPGARGRGMAAAGGPGGEHRPSVPAPPGADTQRTPSIMKANRPVTRHAGSRRRHWAVTAAVAVAVVLAAGVGIALATRDDGGETATPPSSPPTVPPTAVWGFVRSDAASAPVGQPQVAASSTQAGSWQADPSGADAKVSVVRAATGRYAVTFPRIAVPGGSGAAVATAVSGPGDGGGGHCHVAGWAATGADERVDVACWTAAGADVDSAFTALFTYAPDSHRPGGGQPYAYFRNDAPSTHRVAPKNAYSFSGPGTIEINRIGDGHYNIDLIGRPYARTGNNLQVNAVGDTAAGCNALGREAKADRQTIFVGCATGEQWADTPFVVVYGNQHGMLPVETYPFGHAFNGITQAGGPVMQPPLGQVTDAWFRYSANTAAETNTVLRLEVGGYEVTFPGIGLAPDHAQVTPYGEPTPRCVLDGWTSAPAGGPPGVAVVSFHCVGPDGEPVDTFASISYVSATPGASIAPPRAPELPPPAASAPAR